MFVRSISVRRDNDFGYGAINLEKPFIATVAVEGQHGKVELALSTDLSRRIVEIIAEEMVAATRATAEAMTADIFTTKAIAAPEGAF